MRAIESNNWKEKVTPALLKRYEEAMARQEQLAENVILEYWGDFSDLPLEVEILSAIDHQLQVSISLKELPEVASIKRIKAVKLPYYFTVS